MFDKEEKNKEKYRVIAIFYVMANSEEEALRFASKTLVEDADEKRIVKMRRS